MRSLAQPIALLFLTAFAGSARAEEIDGGVVSTTDWGSERVLGGHIFQYPTLTDSAFLASTLNFQVLFSYNTTRTTPLADVDITKVEQLAPVINTQLTLHVAEPVSVFLNIVGAAASGISASSLVLKGETLSYSFRGGAILRLLRDEKSATQLALLGSARYAAGAGVNLRGLVDILQGNSSVTISDILTGSLSGILFTPFNSYAGTLDVAVAHAFARWLSLQASLGLTVDVITSDPFNVVTLERDGTSQVNSTPDAALALTIEGNSWHVPVALQLEYRLAITWVNANSTVTTGFSNAFDLGIFYSGRPDLQAGIVLAGYLGAPPLGALGPATPGSTASGFGSFLTMRYVW